MQSVIQVDRQILGGIPCFAGTRVPIRSLFDHLKLNYSIEEFLEQFPTVEREHVEALLEQASQQLREAVHEPVDR